MVKERRYLEVANIFIIKNALKNINRNKARYIIVSIIMIITAVISSMIHLTTSSVIDNYSKRFGASIYFTPDLKKVINLPTGTDGTILIPDIPTNQLIDFSKSDYLKSTLFTGSLHGFSDSLRGLDQGGQENSGQGAFIPSDDNNESEIKRQVPNIVVIGYSDLSLLEDFQLGLREIHKGRFFKDTNECIVSEEFSKLNELEIGDIITVSNVDNQDQILNLHISHNPYIIIADEPTSNLDSETEESSMEILSSLVVNDNKCVIIVSHSTKVASYANEVWGISNGRFLFIQ